MLNRQYLKFLINGGVLGLISLQLQTFIYHALGGDSSFNYSVASTLTYLPLIIINFLIQKKWIFQRKGFFWKFVSVNIFIMVMVSLFSPLCRIFITFFIGIEWGDRCGFAVASIVFSVPSFFLKRFFVFGLHKDVL